MYVVALVQEGFLKESHTRKDLGEALALAIVLYEENWVENDDEGYIALEEHVADAVPNHRILQLNLNEELRAAMEYVHFMLTTKFQIKKEEN